MNTMTSTNAKQIAETILAQLGSKALFMMGASSFSHGTFGKQFDNLSGVSFRIKGSRSCSAIIIVLDTATDYYNVHFCKMVKFEFKAKAFKGIDVNNLHNLISDETGLALSL